MRFFLPSGVVVCLIAAASIAGVAPARAQSLNDQIKALTGALASAAVLDADIKKSLIDLRAAIGVLEAKAPPDAAADAAAFPSRVDDIVAIAGRLASNPTLPIAAKASALIAAAQPLELADPTRAAIGRADALSLALPNAISTYPKLRTSVNALFIPMEAVEEVDFLAAVNRRSNSLSALLTKAAGAGPPSSLDAIKNLGTLDAAILAYRKHADPMVDIVYAEYGDMRDHTSPRKGRRPQLCDATDAMRKQCQGHQSCTLPATALCPVDPGAFIPSEYKGTWVQFQCVDPLLNVYAPPAFAGMVASRGNSTWVPLRTATDEFRCTPAQPSAPAAK